MTRSGIAYVYDLGGGTPTVPALVLYNPTPGIEDWFGFSVVISGQQVVIGAPQDDTKILNAGSAYVYDLASGTPTVPAATLDTPTPGMSDQFGLAVALSGSRMVVGSPFDDTAAPDAGLAYVYDFASATPTLPVLALSNPFAAMNGQFGRAVAISGSLVVVGAPFTERVYVYDLAGGTPTQPVATLSKPFPVAGDGFGSSVAITGTRIVVGAPGDDTGANGAGSAYVYDLASGTPTVPLFTLNNPEPAAFDSFATAVAISGDRVVVGAYLDSTGASQAGSAYVYDLTSPTPLVPIATLNNPAPADQDYFGSAVAISGTRVVVGAERDDTGADAAGSAYVYDVTGPTPTVPIATLNNPSPEPDDAFGISVAIFDTRVVVGAYQDNMGTANVGRAYAYDLTSATPTVPIATLQKSSPADGDQFGFSVAMDGVRIAVGAYGDATTAINKGATYIFALGSAPPVDVETVVVTDGQTTGGGLPAGTTFDTFTPPGLGTSGGTVLTPGGRKLDAVFNEQAEVLLRAEQVVPVDPAGGGEMQTIAKLQAPTGDAVLAKLAPALGVGVENDEVLFTGLLAGDPQPAARKGQEVPGLPGVQLRSFVTVDGNGPVTFFLGKLKGAGIGKTNDTGLFAIGPAGFRLLVRQGMMVAGKEVKIVAALVGQAGTLVEGRWRSGPDAIGTRLTFRDKSQALFLIPADATGPMDWVRIAQTDDDAAPDLPGGKLLSFQLPAYAPKGTVFDALLRRGPGDITRKNNRVIFDALGVDVGGPVTLRRLAQLAGPVPAPSGGNVVGAGLRAFLSTLAGLGRASTYVGQGNVPGRRGSATAIYDALGDGIFKERARLGDLAPGGGRFDRFVSVAKPDGVGRGALISALLKVSGREGVSAKNRAALFAVDSTGMLRRILRAGDQLESAGPGTPLKTVRSFVALMPAAGSIGAARGYDDAGRVAALVTFVDRTQAVVSLQVP